MFPTIINMAILSLSKDVYPFYISLKIFLLLDRIKYRNTVCKKNLICALDAFDPISKSPDGHLVIKNIFSLFS